jgi:hydrogenase expression/formation protein HypC
MCLAIPGRIKTILPSDGVIKKAKVAFGHIVKEACLDMVPQAKVGDYVLVHAGVAINLVNKEEARKTFEYLKHYGGLEDLMP